MTATPPRADLRTRATRAAHDVDCPDGPNCGDELTTDGRYGRYADAVLAAVLPEHRRMVRRETLRTLLDRADSFSLTMDGQTAAQWLPRLIGDDDKAAVVLDRLAIAAPPAGASAPVPAEPAPAAPEEPDGQRAGEGFAPGWLQRQVDKSVESLNQLPPKLRASLHPGRQEKLDPIETGTEATGSRVRCACDDFGDGECVVHDALTYAELESERDRLARELYEANCELAVLKSKPLFSTRRVMRVLLEALGDPVDEQELTLRIDDGLRLADVAQRVVAALALTAAERDVVEAAKAWRARIVDPPNLWADDEDHALIAAVDALSDAGTDQTEDETDVHL
jgi:hypothetical protein